MKWTGCLEFCREFFITLSNFLYIYNLVPRVTSAEFLVVSGGSSMWRHPSRLSARIRQEHVPKNGHPKWRRWFSYHNTSKDNGHHFSLLTISKTVHKCSEGIYLNLKCSRSTFVEQLWEFFLADLELLDRCWCCCCCCCFFARHRAIVFGSKPLSAHLDSANWCGTTHGLWAPNFVLFIITMHRHFRLM